MERSVSHATDQRETVLAAVAALERKLAREVQAVPTYTQLNSLLEERLAEFEAVSEVQGGRLNTVEATATQVGQHTSDPNPNTNPNPKPETRKLRPSTLDLRP